MVEIKCTNFAIQNLTNIGDFIEQDSYSQSVRVVNILFNSVDILRTFPDAGRMVPEFQDKNIRELIRIKFRIVYLVLNEDRIDILTVHHSARLLPVFSELYNNSELSP